MERIIKSKRKSVCRYCDKDIDTPYKVKHKYDKEQKTSRYFHLTCYYKMALNRTKVLKTTLKEQNRIKRKMKRYTKEMIVENL